MRNFQLAVSEGIHKPEIRSSLATFGFLQVDQRTVPPRSLPPSEVMIHDDGGGGGEDELGVAGRV